MLRWLVTAGLVSTGAAAFKCGRVPLDDALESRVVGGHAPAEGNWPFFAFVQNDVQRFACSGSIVGPRHVLTAGHCVDNNTHPMPENINASHFRVHTGSVRLNNGTWRAVKTVFTGPQWFRSSFADGLVDDVTILELQDAIDFNDYAQPICLPKSFRERPGDPGYFVGWGIQNNVSEPSNETTDYDQAPTVANENIVTFQKWSHCEGNDEYDDYEPYVHREDYICGGQTMRFAHKGDSGGPLMVNRKGTWFQVGTDSGGRTGDGRGYDVFARVTAYCKWFRDVTAGEVNCVKL